MAEVAVGVHREVAYFARVAGRSGQRPAADHDAGADAAFAPKTDEVVRAAAGSTQMLGRGGKVRIVPNEHRDVQLTEPLTQEIPHRNVPPAEVGCVTQIPIHGAYRARNGDSDGHDTRLVAESFDQRAGQTVNLVHDPSRIGTGKRSIVSDRVDHPAPKADDRGADPVGG